MEHLNNSQEVTEGNQQPVISFNDVALLLTVLDKEAYNASYFRRMVDSPDSDYVGGLERLADSFARMIETSQIIRFVDANRHLSKFFLSRLEELGDDDSENLKEIYDLHYPNN